MEYKDIQYKKDKIYKINNTDNCIIIDNNTIIIEFMHYCYSHSIMDFVFPIYWIIQDIKKISKIDKFNLFLKHPKHPNNFKIYKDNNFIGIFNELINILEVDNIIFEFNIKQNLIIKNAFIIDSVGEWISSWQRGVWNCSQYYPQRIFNIKDTYYTDDIIYNNLKEFVSYTKNKLNVKTYDTKNNMIIIERKSDRQFDFDKLNCIKNLIQLYPNIKFNGIITLEEMKLKEQIDLFSKNNIFLFRHGSCLINLLWIPENSIVIDMDHLYNRKNIVGRICKLTNSEHHYLNYNKDNTNYLKSVFIAYSK